MITKIYKSAFVVGSIYFLSSLGSVAQALPSSLDSRLGYDMQNMPGAITCIPIPGVEDCTNKCQFINYDGTAKNDNECFDAGALQAEYSAIVENHNSEFDGIQCTPGFPVSRMNYVHILVSAISKAYANKFIHPVTGIATNSFLKEALICGISKMEGRPISRVELDMHLPQYRLYMSYVGRGAIQMALSNFPQCTLDNPNHWFKFVRDNTQLVEDTLTWGDGTYSVAGKSAPVTANFNRIIADLILDPNSASCCAKHELSPLAEAAICG